MLKFVILLVVSFFSIAPKIEAITTQPDCNPEWGVLSATLPDINSGITPFTSFKVKVTFDTTNHANLYTYDFHVNMNGNWYGNNGKDTARLSPGESTIDFDLPAPNRESGANEFSIDLQHVLLGTRETCQLGILVINKENLMYVNPIFDRSSDSNGRPFKATVQVGSTTLNIPGDKNCAQISPSYWTVPAGNKCSAKTPIVKSPTEQNLTITQIQQLNDDGSVNQSVIPKIISTEDPAINIKPDPPYGPFTALSPFIGLQWTSQTNIGPVTLVGDPSIESGSINRAQPIAITVTLAPTIAHEYQIVLNRQKGSFLEKNEITIKCPGGKDCFAVKSPGTALESTSDTLTKDGDNYKFTFAAPANFFEPGSQNPLTISVPSLNQEFAKKIISIASSGQCKLNLQLSKDSFTNTTEAKSSNVEIAVINNAQNAANFSPGNYEVYINDNTFGSFPCTVVSNCKTNYSLSNAKIINVENSSTYTLIFRNQSNNSICGEATITVGGDPTLGGNKGGTGEPGRGPNGCGSNCTSAGGKSCNTTNGEDVWGIVQPDGALKYFDNNGPIEDKNVGILTAIGCVPTEPTELVKGVSKFITGAAGGIALLLMVIGALQVVTSGGNPEGVKAGQERLTSAAIGLVFIILSVTLLRIIGVDILNIPGFS